MEHLLNTPALQSFDQFFPNKPPLQGTTRTRNVIVRLATRDGFTRTLNLRDIVTYGYDEDPKKVEKQWLKIEGCGTTGLKSIDEWLESLGLHRGTKP